jgi:2'-5' RNA ligase
LGDTSPGQAKELERLLEQVAERCKIFQGSLKGLGYFKTKRQPRVLFAGIFDAEQLEILANEIDTETEKLGFAKENRSYKPHLTLARIKFLKNKKDFYQLVDQYKSIEFQVMPVNEVIFYQSVLKPAGPVYHPLKTISLKNRNFTCHFR